MTEGLAEIAAYSSLNVIVFVEDMDRMPGKLGEEGDPALRVAINYPVLRRDSLTEERAQLTWIMLPGMFEHVGKNVKSRTDVATMPRIAVIDSRILLDKFADVLEFSSAS